MELVVDANILLASFLKEAVTRELLLDSRLILYAPEHLLSETSRHLEKSASLRKRIRLSNDEIQQLFRLLTMNIRTISKQSYRLFFNRALALAPHKEDAPYLAVALLYEIPIWSNDSGLKNQPVIKIYTTTDLLKILNPRNPH